MIVLLLCTALASTLIVITPATAITAVLVPNRSTGSAQLAYAPVARMQR